MGSVDLVLPRIRRICLALPETWEGTSFGNPTFHAGKKTFSVVETVSGLLRVTFKSTPEEQRRLIQRERFQMAPFTGKYGWLCMDLSAGVDWTEVHQLIQESYRLVALKRMLQVLDTAPPRRSL